jgi:hypothetical protein
VARWQPTTGRSRPAAQPAVAARGAAAIVLIAVGFRWVPPARRADQISSELALHDYQTNLDADQVIKLVHELTTEIHAKVCLTDHLAPQPRRPRRTIADSAVRGRPREWSDGNVAVGAADRDGARPHAGGEGRRGHDLPSWLCVYSGYSADEGDRAGRVVQDRLAHGTEEQAGKTTNTT